MWLLLLPLLPLAIVLTGLCCMVATLFVGKVLTMVVVAPTAVIISVVAPNTHLGKRCKEWIYSL